MQAMLFSPAEEVRDRIASAILTLPTPSNEYDVLSVLKGRDAFGRHRAVSIETIQTFLPLSQRAVRDTIKTLLEEHDIPIGSSRIPGQHGYFFCISDEDAAFATRHLKNEIFSLFARIKKLDPKSKFVRELQGQMMIMEGEESDEDSN